MSTSEELRADLELCNKNAAYRDEQWSKKTHKLEEEIEAAQKRVESLEQEQRNSLARQGKFFSDLSLALCGHRGIGSEEEMLATAAEMCRMAMASQPTPKMEPSPQEINAFQLGYKMAERGEDIQCGLLLFREMFDSSTTP